MLTWTHPLRVLNIIPYQVFDMCKDKIFSLESEHKRAKTFIIWMFLPIYNFAYNCILATCMILYNKNKHLNQTIECEDIEILESRQKLAVLEYFCPFLPDHPFSGGTIIYFRLTIPRKGWHFLERLTNRVYITTETVYSSLFSEPFWFTSNLFQFTVSI